MLDQFQVLGVMTFVWLLLMIAWIITLIKQAKDGDWVWFVLTLVFPVALIIYWIVKIFSR